MGYTPVGEEGSRLRFQGASADHGQYVDLLVQPGLGYGQLGAGSVHHVAFRTADDAEQLEYKDALTAVGLGPTPVQDRQYFHSIYFREPAGTLFEIATDAPGFAWDEPVDSLGRELKLPPWLEGQRAVVDARLPVLVSRNMRRGVTCVAAPGTVCERQKSMTIVHEPACLHGGVPLEQADVAVILLHGRGCVGPEHPHAGR
ncbi:MAG: VOC family protein [Caldilineaceae bacterium]